MSQTSCNVEVDDRETMRQVHGWLRKLVVDGMAEHGLDAIQVDTLMALELRYQEMRSRVTKTGILMGPGEPEIERLRRLA